MQSKISKFVLGCTTYKLSLGKGGMIGTVYPNYGPIY